MRSNLSSSCTMQAVLLIPGLLLGLGSPIVMATTFEFISAQSPSSMKGLLVGVFFTVL